MFFHSIPTEIYNQLLRKEDYNYRGFIVHFDVNAHYEFCYRKLPNIVATVSSKNYRYCERIILTLQTNITLTEPKNTVSYNYSLRIFTNGGHELLAIHAILV